MLKFIGAMVSGFITMSAAAYVTARSRKRRR